MKFKKNEELFDNIFSAKTYWCGWHQPPCVGDRKDGPCSVCKLSANMNGKNISCASFCEKFPRLCAEMMGFEIIDDEQEPATAKEFPFDISNMTLAQAKEYCKRLMKENHPCDKGCELDKNGICCATLPRNWGINIAGLTTNELEICKMLGAKWVSVDFGRGGIDAMFAALWKNKPELIENTTYIGADLISSIDRRLFPSVKPGDCICVEEHLYSFGG